MYSSTEPAAAAPERPSKSLIGAFRMMWRLMAVVFCYWLLQWGSLDLLQAFFRSVVVCPTPLPVYGKCPIGGRLDERGTCSAVPKTSAEWSGSARCVDKSLVVSQGTATVGKASFISHIAKILSQVFVGAAMLDTLGRKPVVLMGIASLSMLLGVLWFACHLPIDMAMSLIYLGLIVSSLADSFAAASMAMVSDLAGGDEQWQSLGFAAVNILRHLGIVLAFGGGFPLLSMYLEDYTMVWGLGLVFSCVAVTVAAVILNETMGSRAASAGSPLLVGDIPDGGRRSDRLEGGGGGGGGGGSAGAGASGSAAEKAPKAVEMVDVMAETGNAFRSVWNDPFLRGMLSLVLITNIASYGSISILTGYGLEVVGLRQQVVSLGGVLQPIAIVLGSCVAAHALEWLGEARTYMLGLSVISLGLLTVASSAHYRAHAAVGFWAGLAVCGLGFGLSEPAVCKILGRRAGKENYGKVFACKMFMEHMGIALGSYVWSNYIFVHADGPRLAASTGFLISSGIIGGSFVAFSLLRAAYR